MSLPDWLADGLERAHANAETPEGKASVEDLRGLAPELGRLGQDLARGALHSLAAGRPLEQVWLSMEGLSWRQVRRVRAAERIMTVDERAQRDRDAAAFRAKALAIGIKGLQVGGALLLGAL